MAGLIPKLKDALIEQNCLPNTLATYCFWVRKLYGYCKLPASQWDGDLVRRWMLQLHADNYSARSRKQALCAVVFTFKHVLKLELGHLDLPLDGVARPAPLSAFNYQLSAAS